jgi:hypothetical protein
LVVDPPTFLRDAAKAERWNILDERRRLILCRLLEWLGAKSLRLSRDSAGKWLLIADTGRQLERQQVTLNDIDPKATLAALDRLVLQLEAAEQTADLSAG